MIYLPNLLTLARIGMVPFLIVLLQEQEFLWSLGVFLVAGATDALDGFLAKKFNAHTQLGAILDPLADKALILSAYVTLSVLTLIPFWLVVVVVFRDVIIITGYLVMTLFFGSIEMRPLHISKLNTFLQIFYILLALASLSELISIAAVLPFVAFAVLVTSVVSGGAYVYIWSIKATNSAQNQTVD